MIKHYCLFFAFIFVLFQGLGAAQVYKGQLSDDWYFRQAGEEQWQPAGVPGCVHTDLMNNGHIANPYYRDVERNIQWVGKKDWEYKTGFQVDESLMSRSNIGWSFTGWIPARMFI
ncbi:MAG: hypothetical protein U5R06_21295 [candidate division KSB1 bacterium]|nr:hypothetical protein [candidate division KSB1 bacterium]